MNECPTLVRTGTPPCSRTTSGTALEQIRLWRIVAPGFDRSTADASSAVVVDPLRPCPSLVHDEDPVGIAVEGQAEIETARHHTRSEVALVRRLERIGGMVRKRAVEFGVHHLEVDAGQPLHHRGNDESTHPVRRVGDDLHRADVVGVDEADDVIDELGEQILLGTGAALHRRTERCARRAPARRPAARRRARCRPPRGAPRRGTV